MYTHTYKYTHDEIWLEMKAEHNDCLDRQGTEGRQQVMWLQDKKHPKGRHSTNVDFEQKEEGEGGAQMTHKQTNTFC